jgi:O6-methylguanine-DNA--protein-cysteine methyltransferase
MLKTKYILVPCHIVIASNGKFTGYVSGFVAETIPSRFEKIMVIYFFGLC